MAKYNVRQAVRNALAIPRDVVGGALDYRKEDIAAHSQAMKTVGEKQKAMVSEIHRTAGNSPTPMGENAFYGAVSTEAKRIKKEKGVSLVGSIKKRLKNPND